MGQFKSSVEETIFLASRHSLMLGHMPSKIPENKYGDISLEYQPEKFGLLNCGFFSGPDYNTFYPGLTKDDFMPKEGDFVNPTFRLLSEVIVNKSYNPVDFSKGNVLKDSMSLMLGQAVTPDHNTDVADAIGSVKQVFWQRSYESDNGVKVPAGMNGVLQIDAISNPRIARGLLMDPPSIHSNSVSVNFLWDKSHPNMDNNEFWNNLGSYDEKGELVRKICTGIKCYYHTSLVGHGADPFAQLTKDKKIVNPTHAGRQDYSSDNTPSVSYYIMSYKNNPEVINNTMAFNMQEDNNLSNEFNKHNKANMEFNEVQLLSTLVGVGLLQLEDGVEVTKDSVIAALKALVVGNENLSNQVGSLTTDVSTRDTRISELEVEVATLTDKMAKSLENATLGESYLSNLRDSVTSDYKKLKGDKADESMLSLIATMSHVQLTAIGKEYKDQLEALYPMSCSDCGSKNVNRSSSVSSKSDEGNEEHKMDYSTTSVIRGIAENKRKNSIYD